MFNLKYEIVAVLSVYRLTKNQTSNLVSILTTTEKAIK